MTEGNIARKRIRCLLSVTLLIVAETLLTLVLFTSLTIHEANSEFVAAQGKQTVLSAVQTAMENMSDAADAASSNAKEEAQAEIDGLAEIAAEEARLAEEATQARASSSSSKTTGSANGNSNANTTLYQTLIINGNRISYKFCYDATSAPSSGAGVWMGSDSTTDGSYCYFIGHNPGSFSCVTNLRIGSMVTVWDSNGNNRTYTALDCFKISQDSYWSDLSSRVTGYGESIALQTCCGNDMIYVVVCA